MQGQTKNFEIEIEDVEYLRHGDRPLLARVFKPQGQGPFPAIVELHGGAWCNGDRTNDDYLNRPLAQSGVIVAALDFRMPPEAPYPASMADINYGIRWLKGQAAQWGSHPDLVGALGISSGGHQAMLAAMRPDDRRYGALADPVNSSAYDASLNFVVMCWPVISPLGRYQYALALKQSGKPYPAFIDDVLPSHHAYWITEAAMAEGNPVLILERREAALTPPVLYLQGSADLAHPRPDLDRFVANYRRAGGQVELELFEGQGQAFIRQDLKAPAAVRAIQRIIEFVHEQARPAARPAAARYA